MLEAMHLQNFAGGFRIDNAIFSDTAFRGSFWHQIVSEGKAILDEILKNTVYTGIYDGPPEES
jgi:hypothetical protein